MVEGIKGNGPPGRHRTRRPFPCRIRVAARTRPDLEMIRGIRPVRQIRIPCLEDGLTEQVAARREPSGLIADS